MFICKSLLSVENQENTCLLTEKWNQMRERSLHLVAYCGFSASCFSVKFIVQFKKERALLSHVQ